MRRFTAAKFQILASTFIVIGALLGSSMLAGGRLTRESVWTVAAAGVPEQPPGPVSYPGPSGMGSRIAPRASISGSQTIKDGGTATFSVSAGGAAAAYQWSFRAPAGAVNGPAVTFSSPSEASTSAQGRWFALPDTECAPSGDSADPYWNSIYTIVCTITFSDGHQQKAQTTLTVNAYWNPAGATGTPSISGGPTIGHDTSKNLWVVIDAGTLKRNLPTPMIYVPSSSQFYDKVVAHENKHVEQWKSGMLSDLYDISTLMMVLYPLSDSTQEGLSKKLGAASMAWVQGQDREFQHRLRAAEKEAHQISDPIAPRYCYQYCGP